MALAHFKTIAAASDLPIILFQYPMAGGLGYPLAFATTALIEAGSALAPYGLIASATACHLGLLAHSVFTWKVFRPHTGWARAAVIAVAAAAVVGFAGNASVGFGDPADVAAVVSFLASAAGGYITGQVICVDGGMAM